MTTLARTSSGIQMDRSFTQETAEARLTRIATVAAAEKLPIKFRIHCTIYDYEKSCYVGDKRECVIAQCQTQVHVEALRMLFDDLINAVGEHGPEKIAKAIEGVG